MRYEDLPEKLRDEVPKYRQGRPLRPWIAGLGLIGLIPTSWYLMQGDLTLMEAGVRAAIILGLVVFFDKILTVAFEAVVRHAAVTNPRAVVTDVKRLED